jgi:xanthine dehydrogenase YagR molybdenum-binding subunit
MAVQHGYNPAASPKLGRVSVVGKPLNRLDGVEKVTGQAKYAYEYATSPRAAYGYIVEATIAKGRILSLDTTLAERAPGVRLVVTHLNAPKQASFGPPAVTDRNARARPVLVDAAVQCYGQPIALVVAETFEQARAAAALVRARYSRYGAALVLEENLPNAYRPALVGGGQVADTALGNFASAFAAAPVKIDGTYENGYQNHNPMEPHAALALWNGDSLTAYVSQQNIASARAALAATLQMPRENVHLISRYIGGGFGSKLPINPEVVLAALAARMLGRPVKVALTRPQMFSATGHRPTFRQRVRLGADQDGSLTAIAHESWSQTARVEEFAEQAATCTRSLYAAPNRLTRHRLVPLDIQHGETMRAPGEASGLLALESAMDELAAALELDPVELRLRNEPKLDPERHVPFSSRRLATCLHEGALRFGWNDRPKTPRSRRDGRQLIGFGVSAGIRPNKIGKASAEVTLRPGGGVTARLDMTDIGTGSYTILTQVTADALGVPLQAVSIEIGHSDFPETTGSGGSLGAGSSCSALYNACVALHGVIARTVTADARSPFYGSKSADIVFRDGRAITGNVSEALSDIAARSPGLSAVGTIEPGETYQRYSQFSFAAYFAEVQVDMDTAEIRARRMLGVFDVGRALNARTARSQLLGGMIWGLGAALHEEGVIDTRYGNLVNADLAGYHFPSNADAPAIEVVILDGVDYNSNPVGSKGVGELGICGSGAAIANAIYSATGVRVRSFPITLDKILSELSA